MVKTSGVFGSTHESASLRDYLAVVRRRKWIILQATILVPLAAVLFSLQQTPVYQASADVLLSRQNLANTLNGLQDPNASTQDSIFTQTQADLAQSPTVAARVLQQLHLTDRTVKAFLSASSVTPATNSDVLHFTVKDTDAALAVRLTSAYAEQYRAYRRQLDTQALEAARRQVQERIAALPKKSGALYASLSEREQQLSTMEALQGSNVAIVSEPTVAEQVSPRPKRNGALGFVLGILLGVGLAFLREALDTRVRSAEEIAHLLGLPLLSRVPAPPGELREQSRLVMMAEPTGAHSEAFRMLRTNLEFACVDRNVRTLMVTSAVEQEGKTTTASNLAIALARGGARVLLVDLDLRRPAVEKFFDLRGKPGLTQVVLRRAQLEEAVVRIPLTVPVIGNGDGRRMANNQSGRLYVLGAGPIPPDPGEFVATAAVSELLDEVCERVDIVIVDAPPLLHVGDALALSAKADALVLITKLETIRRPMLAEMRRVLEPLPTLKLGFVVTGAELEQGYGYGYGYGYYSSYHREPAAPLEEPVE